jgi:hypothetical protein
MAELSNMKKITENLKEDLGVYGKKTLKTNLKEIQAWTALI